MFELISVTNCLAFALVCFIVHIVYTLIIKHWNYFEQQNVEYERGIPAIGTFLGNIPTLLGKRSVPESTLDIYSKHSNRKIIGMYDIGGKPSYLVRDLDLINKITIKDFDSFVNHFFRMDKDQDPLLGRSLFSMTNQPWRDMRSTLSPLFTGSKMRHMLTLMNECGAEFNAHIRNDILSKSKTNRLEYDVNDLMMRLANDVIGSTAFGIQINTLKEPDHEFFKFGKQIAYAITGIRALVYLAFPKLATFLNLKLITDRQDSFFRNVINSTLEQRKKQNIVRNDMLHLLMLAKEGKLNEEQDLESDQDTGFATVSEFITTKTSEKLKNWTDEDLVAQCVVFFLAGFTGVSSTFCFLIHELAANPRIQDRLYEEIVETKNQLNGNELIFEALQKMKYMDMVVSETLRLWSIATISDRVVSKQYLVEDYDGTKVLLQPNSTIWIPTFAIHRDPKYFPNPNTFDPDRFSSENKNSIPASAYAPFGNGPRACIASRFALLQIKALIYHILSDFKLECSPKTQIPLKLKGGTNALVPTEGFFNYFTIRN